MTDGASTRQIQINPNTYRDVALTSTGCPTSTFPTKRTHDRTLTRCRTEACDAIQMAQPDTWPGRIQILSYIYRHVTRDSVILSAYLVEEKEETSLWLIISRRWGASSFYQRGTSDIIFVSMADVWTSWLLSSFIITYFYQDYVETRWAWQSQTWGRPAPQVRVESQFRYSKFLSRQCEHTTPKTVS